jgi:hypothetical protein
METPMNLAHTIPADATKDNAMEVHHIPPKTSASTEAFDIRGGIAWSASNTKHKVWIVLKAERWEIEEAVRLEFAERYGVEPDDAETWAVLPARKAA